MNIRDKLNHYLLPKERSSLRRSLEAIHQDRSLNPYKHYNDERLISILSLRASLPERILLVINQFSLAEKEVSLLIKGFPKTLHFLPPTPSFDHTTNGKDFISEYLLLSLAKELNLFPYQNVKEKDGAIIQQLIPISQRAHEASGVGYKVPLDFHTENIHEPDPPSCLALFCLQGDPHAKTLILPVDKLLNNLPAWVIEGMMRDDFEMRSGASYENHHYYKTSLLRQDRLGQYHIRFNLNNGRVIALNLEAQKVLDYLYAILQKPDFQEYVILEPGDCLLLSNSRCLHGRSAFQLSTGFLSRRWVQRLYMSPFQFNLVSKN